MMICDGETVISTRKSIANNSKDKKSTGEKYGSCSFNICPASRRLRGIREGGREGDEEG